MKVGTVFLSFLVLLFLSANSFSQRPVPKPSSAPILINGDEDFNSADFYKVGEITGNLGGAKAILLPKPAYSENARDAGAEGKVKIEIEIDEDGAVTSAKAVSGNPLLFEDARKAALNSKFSAPKINGEKQKVFGFLTYNFSIAAPNWFKVGYDLSLVEKMPSLAYLQIPLLKKLFKSEWENENGWLDELQEIKAEEKIAFAKMTNDKPALITEKSSNSTVQTSQWQLFIPPQNPQKPVLANKLLEALPARLADDAANLWKFNLGAAFIEMRLTYRSPATGWEAANILKPFLQNIPDGVAAEYRENLGNLIKLLEGKAETDFRFEIAKTVGRLQRIK